MSDDKPTEIQQVLLAEQLKEFKVKASVLGFHIRVPKEEFAYKAAREISNSYFNHKPVAVASPRNAAQIISCLKFCTKTGLKFRIRSGGHHHEGMCSADNIFMLRLSDINLIQYQDDEDMFPSCNSTLFHYITPSEAEKKEKAWIGVGCKLKAVYDELELYGKMIPGGGCWNVNVGGLTQGGGWGMNSRKYGLTCDNILAAEIILANKTKVIATADNEYKDLFKAICGGGGGNFGIVTRFLFQLQDVTDNLSSFSIYWSDKKMEDMIVDWLELQTKLTPELIQTLDPRFKDNPKYDTLEDKLTPDLAHDLTTFLRIQVDRPDEKQHFPIRAGGLFHGTVGQLKIIMNPFVEKYKAYQQKETDPKYKAPFKTIRPKKTIRKQATGYSNSLIFDTFTSLADAFNYDTFDSPIGNLEANDDKCKVAPPDSNCGAPHPHKVSSVFSNNTGLDYYERIAGKITSYYKRPKPPQSREVRSYMTFHTLGGKIKDEPKGGSGYAFRDREFLMQFQSWWNYPKVTKETKSCASTKKWQQAYIDWVKEFRKHMTSNNDADGAFINFIDKDLSLSSGLNYKTAQGKYDLLKVYYGDKLNDLIDIKRKYDPNESFLFEMSIPNKLPPS